MWWVAAAAAVVAAAVVAAVVVPAPPLFPSVSAYARPAKKKKYICRIN